MNFDEKFYIGELRMMAEKYNEQSNAAIELAWDKPFITYKKTTPHAILLDGIFSKNELKAIVTHMNKTINNGEEES